MEVSIIVEYKGKEYPSDFEKTTQKELDQIVAFLKIPSKDLNYLSIQRGNRTIFFGQQVLKESIITICKSE